MAMQMTMFNLTNQRTILTLQVHLKQVLFIWYHWVGILALTHPHPPSYMVQKRQLTNVDSVCNGKYSGFEKDEAV